MLIICPSCASSYEVKPTNMPPLGRRVRCLRCQTVWHAEPSNADKLLAAAAAIAPGEGAVESDDAAGAAPLTETTSAGARSNQPAAQRSGESQPEDSGSPKAANGAIGGTPSAYAAATPFNEPSESAEVEAPPIAPVDLDAGASPIDIDADHSIADRGESPVDIESVAARRQRRGARRPGVWPLSRLQCGILALLLIDSVLIGWRSEIVWALPQTGSFYASIGLPVNLRGLGFDGVVTTTERHEGVPILVVEGNVVNTTRKIVDVPRLKFIVRNAARQEIYSWTAVPARTLLPPGETMAFRSRLASPPPEAHDIILRFVNRRDLVATTR
jgi:predicted Zn finger-like uncharacterized protein